MLRRVLIGWLLFVISFTNAVPQTVKAAMHGSASTTAYEGLVASRARQLSSNNSPGNFQTQARSAHIATENLTSIRLAFGAFYNAGSIGGTPIQDTGLGATTAITASIEYPAGTCVQAKFSGSSGGTIANAGVLFSDYATVNIPSGATFWVRNLRTSTGGILFNNFQNSFLGEAIEVAASGLTDKTASCAAITNAIGWSVPPLAILGMTTNTSVIIVGDSIAAGYADTEDSSNSATGYNGKVGVIARSLGNTPFLNLAVSGENAYTWSTDATGRDAVIQKGSHFLSELGLSDIINHGKTAAQTLTALQSVYALARPGQKIYQTTWTPHASDSGSPQPIFTTLTQQTPVDDSQRVPGNNSIRALLANTVGTIDVASVLESSTNSGKWVVSPTPPYTNQNPVENPAVHPDPAGYLLVQNAGIFPTFTWP